MVYRLKFLKGVKMKKVIDIKILLEKLKIYIERTEETLEGEWGSARHIEELIAEGSMPSLYFEVVDILKDDT